MEDNAATVVVIIVILVGVFPPQPRSLMISSAAAMAARASHSLPSSEAQSRQSPWGVRRSDSLPRTLSSLIRDGSGSADPNDGCRCRGGVCCCCRCCRAAGRRRGSRGGGGNAITVNDNDIDDIIDLERADNNDDDNDSQPSSFGVPMSVSWSSGPRPDDDDDRPMKASMRMSLATLSSYLASTIIPFLDLEGWRTCRRLSSKYPDDELSTTMMTGGSTSAAWSSS